MMNKKRRLERQEAEAIALNVLRFLASDGDMLGRFMAATGTGPQELRSRAAEPEFLGGVLDYILADESLLLAFAAQEGLAPEMPAIARALLPGATSC